MQKQIQYGGKVHSFPDDFTDADIQSALESFDVAATKRPLGASGSWDTTPEQLPAALRIPLKGLAQVGKGATNILRAPLDIAKTAYDAFTADPKSIAPEEVPAYSQFGPGGLFAHRLVAAPQIEQAREAATAPTKSEAFGHGFSAAPPAVGPR